MAASEFPQRLRRWRKLNHVKQASLAADLCVSQAAISRWENGVDFPSPAKIAMLRTIMDQNNDELVVENYYVERIQTNRSLLSVDGIKLICASRGLCNIWPEFSRLTGYPLEDYLVNEAASCFFSEDLRYHVRNDTPLVITGVSNRHLSLQIDTEFRHRWHACLRKINSRSVLDITYESCAPDEPLGIEDVVIVDALTA